MDVQPDRRDLVGGFAKGLQVIAAFAHDRPRLTIADVARLSGLERATARRYLFTLVKAGYAEFDGKFFALTPQILRLGYAYLASTPLPRILQPATERVSEAIGESCSACILDGTDIVYIARSAPRRVMSIGLQVGSRLPAYCASMGRVLLAALPAHVTGAILEASTIERRTPHTKTGLAALTSEIGNVAKQGYSIVDQEIEVGLRSIAVPVYSGGGKVVAALNVGVQIGRASLDDLARHFLPVLRDAQTGLRYQIS
jgi:IclR family pca regulon transcriptional regulator